MEFEKLLYTRTSVRSYKDVTVTAEQTKALLEAAVRAPNACNLQSWYFYAVQDRDKIKAVNSGVAFIPWAKDISLMFIVCVNEDIAAGLEQRFGERGRMFVCQDAAGAINNILLRAADMGLGGCWVGPMQVDNCRKVYGIAKKHTPVAIVTIGVPDDGADALHPRKPLDEYVTYIGAPEQSVDNADSPAEKPFALEHQSLPNAKFEDLNLERASFNNINLQGVKFSDINMSNAFFGGLNLSQSFFGCVDLNDSIFENPCFDGAEFKNCSFKGVVFDGCVFENVKIENSGKPDIEVKDGGDAQKL